MSASVAKATRRDLRRAVGEEAVQIVELHEAAIRQVRWTADTAFARVSEIDKRLLKIGLGGVEAAEVFERGYAQLHRDCYGFMRQGFWGRLRWLLIGR